MYSYVVDEKLHSYFPFGTLKDHQVRSEYINILFTFTFGRRCNIYQLIYCSCCLVKEIINSRISVLQSRCVQKSGSKVELVSIFCSCA